jgi:hypothetical protein
MAHINCDIPAFDCWIRKPFLYDGDHREEGFVRARAFAIASLPGRAVGFHVMTDAGAVIWRMPVHALALRQDAPPRPLDHLQLWQCLDIDVGVSELGYLSERRCMVILKDKTRLEGKYMFTIDWGEGDGRLAGDSGHKCGHVVALDDGNIAIQPNNRMLWADPATITKPFAVTPDYRTNTRIWTCEGKARWATEDSDQMFYGVRESAAPFGADGSKTVRGAK